MNPLAPLVSNAIITGGAFTFVNCNHNARSALGRFQIDAQWTNLTYTAILQVPSIASFRPYLTPPSTILASAITLPDALRVQESLLWNA
jgi:hypothetical protein